jgi:hypothetical protein
MRTLAILFAAVPLLAQISSPQLGYVSHRGELRRIEGLTFSSRLSEPLAICSRLDAGPRFAICATPDGVHLLDPQTRSAVRSLDAYERIVWSPSGLAVALDSHVYNLPAGEAVTADGEIVAISDTGAAATRDALGSLRLRNEIVAGPEATAAAFDGEALLVASGPTLRRIEPGRSAQAYPLAFEPTLLASDAKAFYAANAQSIARIDRVTGELSVFAVPSEEIAITRLDRLEGGALLVASPGDNQPGWLFRDGRFSFIPGIAANTGEVAQ